MTQPAKNSNQAPPSKPAVPERVLRIADPDHSLTFAAFTSRELETLRKACRDSDFEHLWRDFVQPALNRAEGGK